LLGKAGLKPDSFGDTETWAAALALGHAAQGDAEDAANGVDRALLSANHLPVSELEGAQKQLGLFDSLPESAQRAMLASVIEGAPKRRRTPKRWKRHGGAAIWAGSGRRPPAECWPIRCCAISFIWAATMRGRQRSPPP
jgi:hypothetical protein